MSPFHVEHWFNISVDDEIEPIYYCKSTNIRQKQNILSDQDAPFECPERDVSYTMEDIYEPEPGSEDDEGPC